MSTTEAFSDAKRRLLERFLRGEVARQNWEVPLQERRPGDPVPLAPSQQQIWLHSQIAGNAPLYNEPFTLHYRGMLDRAALERSFTELLRRHEIWRTTFASLDGQVVQAVHPHLTIPIPFTDLTALPREQREPEALRIAAMDARRPFDLGVGPLLRAQLVKLENNDHRLYLTVHHLLIDGVGTFSVLLPELSAIYDAFSKGLPSPLPEPLHQYADFAIWEKRLIENDSTAQQMEYWRRTLAGEPPALELPTDRPYPAIPSYRGSMEMFSLNGELTEALKDAAKAEGVTLYMLLLAAFKTLLFRYSGQEDILIGGATDSRRRPEFDRLLGCFVHTVVFRTRPEGERTFREYLAEVKESVLGALAASGVPFDQLVRELHPRRDPSRHPFVQALFASERPQQGSDALWDLTHADVSSGASKVDLYVGLEERPQGIVGRFIYNTDIFDAATIRRMTANWIRLLEGILQDPGLALAELPILAQEESRLVSKWNRTQEDFPDDKCLHELFEEQVRRTPDAVAVVFEGASVSYHELNRRANRLAHHLRTLGVKPDSRVGICLERSFEMVVALLATLKAGGAYVPLDPAYPVDRLRYMLDDGAPIALLTNGRFEGLFPTRNEALHVVKMDGEAGPWSDQPETNPDPASMGLGAGNLAYIIYTSGSTGAPKGVMIEHRSIVNRIVWMQRAYAMDRTDAVLQKTPFSFDVSVWEFFWPLLVGARLVMAEPEGHKDPVYLREAIRANQITTVHFVPSMLQAFLEESHAPNCPTLTRTVCSGEALSSTLVRRFRERFPRVALHNLYGPTEAAVDVTAWTCPEQGPETGIPIGRPIANTRMYVLDRRQMPAPVGAVGELYIGGVQVARGYLNRTALTAERFLPDPFAADGGSRIYESRMYKTGDLGKWLPDGNIEFLGRNDFQVKIRGFRIELGEIEAVLAGYDGVREAVVLAREYGVALEDAAGDKRLVAYYTGEDAIRVEELRDHLAARLPGYMLPSAYVRLEGLPLTTNGKLDRKALPQPDADEYQGRSTQPSTGPGPSTETERRLAAIWESVLDRKGIGVGDNFFDLGGHSLLVAKLLRRVEAEFGTRLSMAAMFQAPTIQQLAELLSRQDLGVRTPKVAVIQNAGSRPPLFWMNAGPRYRALAWHLGKDRPFLGVSVEHEAAGELPRNPSLQEFAACAVRKIRETRPHGPYLLGGWCASGLLAYEVAAQLTAAGEDVGLVAMLDSVNLHHFMAGPVKHLLSSRMRFHWKKLTGGSLGDTGRYLADRIAYHAKRIREGAGTSGELYHATLRYEPPAYGGRVLLLEPADRLDILGLAESWAGVAQPQRDIQQVAGNHENVLEEPTVADIAAHVREAIETAEGAADRDSRQATRQEKRRTAAS